MGGEANILPHEGDTVTTAEGRTLTWIRYRSKGDIVNLIHAVGNYEYATAYAFCILQSESTGDAVIHLGSDDSVTVWIKGANVYRFPIERPFRLDEDSFEVNLKEGTNSCLIKVTNVLQKWEFALCANMLSNCAVLSGIVSDENGEPISDVRVCLEQDGKEIASKIAKGSGKYQMYICPVHGIYDLSAVKGDLVTWQLGIELKEGERQTLNFMLKKVVSIEGTLLMLDGATPHVAVPVQMILDEKVIVAVLSDESGKYQFVNLKPGKYQVRCQVLGGYVYYQATDKALDSISYDSQVAESSCLQVGDGKTLNDINFRFAPFKKGTWRNYTYLDGLVNDEVNAIYVDPDGLMWFGTCGGVSRYDGKEFTHLTTKDGLVHNRVNVVDRDPSGIMWFGTWDGVSRYDGKEFQNFTTENGLVGCNVVRAMRHDPDGTMWFTMGYGEGGGVSYNGKEFANLTMKDGLPSNNVHAIYRDPEGILWFGTWGSGISRYDGKEFINFNMQDGLVSNTIRSIYRDPNGIMWFGSGYGGGVSRYDGREFVNFTTKDGLAYNFVNSINRDTDGMMWFGGGSHIIGGASKDGGLSRYDGRNFVNFTQQDGLGDRRVWAINCDQDQDGIIWFGTLGGGVFRYDPRTFVNFSTQDGLTDNRILAIHRDPDGMMWFATWNGISQYNGERFVSFTIKDINVISAIYRTPDSATWFGSHGSVVRYDGRMFVNLNQILKWDTLVYAINCDSKGVMWFGIGVWERGVTVGGGAVRYDGKEFVRFTTKDGLAGDGVYAIYCNTDGITWFGTVGGVSRYDGEKFINLTTKDGLANNYVHAIYCDLDGVMWFGTEGGVSKYDDNRLMNFTTEDGLGHNFVNSIYQDTNGVMWFGTEGGVSAYDGTAWTSLDTRDGLAGKFITSVLQDVDGFLWFGTEGGVTRYRRSITQPKVYIVSITTDKTYRDLSDIPLFSPGTRITIEYNSIDFKTLPEKRQYRCRIKEIDSDWRKPIKASSFDHVFDKPGIYTFEVQAIDRDLNYSEPAMIELQVIDDPRDLQIAELESEIARRNRELEQELQDAHDMQMSLLPNNPPDIEGFDIAGFSKPAREVGGDFFDYLTTNDGGILIAIADVSGKGLKAAMNAVMVNGILHEMVKTQSSCGEILKELNISLYPRMMKLMFTAMELTAIHPNGDVLQCANAAQPYPIIKRHNELSEIRTDTELPLGMVEDISYTEQLIALQSGDIVILYTDGLIETESKLGEIYGVERLQQFISLMDTDMNSEEIIRAIIDDVTGFSGGTEQYDDMTIVVVKRL